MPNIRRASELARSRPDRSRRRQDRHDRGDLPRRRDRPARVGAVNTGLFGTKRASCRLADARADGRRASASRTRRRRSRTRRTSTPTASSRSDEERRLYRHYGLRLRRARAPAPACPRTADDRAPATPTRHATRRGTVGRDTSRADDRRRDDALRGGAARRHHRARDRPRPPAQVRRRPRSDQDRAGPARGGPRRARADHRRQPRRRASTARRSPRRSTRSCCTPRSPSSRSAPSPRSACAWTRTPSPTRRGLRGGAQGAHRRPRATSTSASALRTTSPATAAERRLPRTDP